MIRGYLLMTPWSLFVFVLITFILIVEFSILGYNEILSQKDVITTQERNNLTNYKTIDYYARFNCGTISDDNGPLRPGKYDSDITIFNKQTYPITISWKAIEINQETKNNFNILNVPGENIVNINCAKISLVGNKTTVNNLRSDFVEGVVMIQIKINNGLLVNNILNNQGENIIIKESELDDLINVDVLHTVNTLSDLNKESFYLKTVFSIQSTGEQNKIENLTAVFEIPPNKIIDPISLIMNHLTENNTQIETKMINSNDIVIKESEIFSNSLVDNHALTVQKIDPVIT